MGDDFDIEIMRKIKVPEPTPDQKKYLEEILASNQPETPKPSINPKDLFGNTKVAITRLPMVAIIQGAHAMMDGANKYGPYNWRDNPVIAHIYVDAAMRHLSSWFEGQENAHDSGVHHLGHVIACCAILLDAQLTGNLVDDRPIKGDPDKLANLLDKLSAQIKAKKALQKS
jgi:hypothetical protein